MAARAAIAALRLYKVLLSPLFAGSCRYLPSCSDYMAEAVGRHGAAAGTALGIRRLARCHPLGGSGFDPVPEDRPWRALVSRRPKAEPEADPARARVPDAPGWIPPAEALASRGERRQQR